MDKLFELKGRASAFYTKYSRYIDRGVRFLIALLVFSFVNNNIGFSSMLANPLVTVAVAIICTLVVNPLVGALYITAVCVKDDNLKFGEEAEEQKEVDIDKVMEKIEKLQKMREQNLINDEEFAKLKADILKGTTLDKKSK